MDKKILENCLLNKGYICLYLYNKVKLFNYKLNKEVWEKNNIN